MQIYIEPDELSRLEILIEKCRYAYKIGSYHKFSDEEDKFFKSMAKRFRREVKDYYKTINKNDK